MRNVLHLMNLWALYGKDDTISQKVIKLLTAQLFGELLAYFGRLLETCYSGMCASGGGTVQYIHLRRKNEN
jgi:hypothetical protein